MKELYVLKNLLLGMFFVLIFSTSLAFGENDILISSSADMENVVFDGKWTDKFEWKTTSLDKFSIPDGQEIVLRSAHYGEFIYFQIDFLTDTIIDKGSDYAMICLDGDNNKNSKSDINDYCFMGTMKGKNPLTFQGGSLLAFNGNFKKIPNPDGFIAIGNVSDENDRYSKIPHASYEFKIPTSLVGRTDSYGFLMMVYDANSNQVYTWPKHIEKEIFFLIPSPDKWGNMISPDKSLPEFNLPILVLIPSLLLIIVLVGRLNLRIFDKLY